MRSGHYTANVKARTASSHHSQTAEMESTIVLWFHMSDAHFQESLIIKELFQTHRTMV